MQKIQLSIPEPCHENWHNMIPTGQGRYCNACAKEVIDFSMMTDTEVLNYFTTPAHEKVCGRALPSQLDRVISRPKEPKKRLFWYWNYIVMFFMLFSKTNSVKAQGTIKSLTELSPAKQAEKNNSQLHIQGDTVIRSRVVTGKVTDIDGNPVSFATIKIKGTSSGVSADANGGYSIKVRPNGILLVSGASFKDTEVTIGKHHMINVILNREHASGLIEIVVADETDLKHIKHVAVFNVKDDESSLSLSNAKIIIAKRSSNLIDTVVTDKNGRYRLKGLKENEEYYIRVEADGYGVNIFTIDMSDFKDKKIEWEVLLSKQNPEPLKVEGATVRSGDNATLGNEVRIRLGSVSAAAVNKGPLYVMDGSVMPHIPDINPDDVNDYSILQGPEATALFGPDGANGAIVVTTRKTKEMSLKEVVVNSDYGIKKTTHCGSICLNGINVNNPKNSFEQPAVQLKVYPNPVQRGNIFYVKLNLPEPAIYNLLIADVSGRTILQKQVWAVAKEFAEKIPADWSSGVYYINITDRNGKQIDKTSFIVQ